MAPGSPNDTQPGMSWTHEPMFHIQVLYVLHVLK